MLSLSLALIASIIVIFILLRLKLHPGFAIFAGSLIVSLLVLPLDVIPSLMFSSLIDYQTVRLLIVVASTLTLSRFMEQRGLLADLATAMESLTPKLAVHFISAAIGFVPMPGGALVSATASSNLFKKLGLKPEQSTFINYWFRHVWEFSIPVYPAIVSASIILNIPLSSLISTMFPMTLLAIAFGAVFSYMMLRKAPQTKVVPSKSMIPVFLKASWPIILIILLILVGVDAIVAFPVTLILLLIQGRPRWVALRTTLKFGLDFKVLFMLYAVMLYKATIESTNAVNAVLLDMQAIGLPMLVIIAAVPFLIGLITGISVAFVAITFPLLAPAIVSDLGVNNFAFILAYVSGMIGMFLSPLHLCLTLSVDYFKASLLKVYGYILCPSVLIEFIALVMYLITT